MSDRWKHGLLGTDMDDGSYKPWRTCQQGSVLNVKLVPAAGSAEPIRFIPYLQPITIELHEETGQMALLCASTGHVIFIEGAGLEELAGHISERRIKSVHAFDSRKHDNQDAGAAIVTLISVDQSS